MTIQQKTKERPILFSAPMVRALLDGNKTQTRRALNTQPLEVLAMKGEHAGREWVGLMTRDPEPRGLPFKCKLGAPGDRLWVRETFFAYGRWITRFSEAKGRDEWHFIDMTAKCDRTYQYAADNPELPLAVGRGPLPGWWKRPAIFMPRAACRIHLEIVSVRVERLNDCSDADALAEGCSTKQMRDGDRLASVYARLWDSINGSGSWAANPWVWCIGFRKVAKC